MAHTCPNCGCTCYCHGDIDDINFGETRLDCDCCNEFEDDFDDGPDDEEFDEHEHGWLDEEDQ